MPGRQIALLLNVQGIERIVWQREEPAGETG
jgi:hypothetical protein